MKNKVLRIRIWENYRMGFFAVLLIVFGFTSQNALAQTDNRFAVEFRPGVNFATSNPGGADVNFGYGLEGVFSYRLFSTLSVYAGWSWNHFEADQSFAGNDVGFEETGYMYGLRYIFPLKNERMGILLGAGGLYNHIELENTEGDIIGDTKHGFGYQVEAGLAIMLGENETFRLTPALRYRALSRDIEFNNVNHTLDLNYLSLGLGIAVQF